MSERISCFKAYDVRGRMPQELDEDLARRIGQAYAQVVRPKRVVVGHDIRLSSQDLTRALIEGLTLAGVDVALIGLCGTEEVYFATAHLKVDGGIMVTASHNPVDYNGMKFVRQESRPISSDSGLREIEAAVRDASFTVAARRGREEKVDTRGAYVKHLLTYVDASRLKPLKIVVNAGNGCASLALDALEKHLPFRFTKVFYEPDGRFPNGVPNPLLPEMRPPTVEALRKVGADLAVAWDGDYDRCFLFDEKGTFIEGYYIVGLLAAQLLRRHPRG
jgi:phosphomannomutase